jgi:hypothetical protein
MCSSNSASERILAWFLPPFDSLSYEQLKATVGKGDVFRSQDVQTGTQFGDYRVDGGIMTATGYNDFLSRLVKRIADSLSAPVTTSSKVFANISKFPFLQVNLPQLSAWVDEFIRQQLFRREFDPMADENWRLLCLDPIAKVNEQKHLFMRLRYVKESGLPGFYIPDFLVRTATANWLVETKAQDQLIHADVQRKRTAAVAWCDRLNQLSQSPP